LADYQKRTDGVRGSSPPPPPSADDGGEAATVHGAPPPSDFQSYYSLECLPRVLTSDPETALRFRAFITYATSSASVTVILHPLLARQKDIASVDPAASDLSAHADVGPDGRFKLAFGAVSVPGTSNPISGSVINVDGTSLEGVFYDSA